jgi:hypothetical protein
MTGSAKPTVFVAARMMGFASLPILRTAKQNLGVIARLDRAIQYAAACRLKHNGLWNTGFPAFRGNDSGGEDTLPRSRGTLMPE